MRTRNRFEEFLNELNNGKTFEEICKEHNNTMVECIENEVYEDEDLYEFLNELGASIYYYGIGYVIVMTDDEKTYKIPCEERENRFDDDLPNETILFFDSSKIYDVTENFR